MAEALGFEPRGTVLETARLPINGYFLKMKMLSDRIELSLHDYQSCVLAIELTKQK